MASPSGCPGPDALKNFAAGLLDGPASADAWRHLLQCDACRGVFENLRNATLGASHRDSTAGDVLANDPPDGEIGKDDPVEMSTLDIGFLIPSNDPKVMGRIGDCNVLGALGRGGMGVVFKAFDTTLHRMVAIKVLSPQLASSGEAKRRFLREARSAAAVNHPNVVVIHAVGEQSGMPYLVMEFVAGRTLHARIHTGKPFDLTAFLRIGAQIADGLAAAHRQGVVHRDIKPRNIMLENGVERVKITDFGLALVALDGSQITSVNRVVGTPAYMSPEQVQGARVDRRSDLFSLGAVLHTMVTGRSPFQGSHALEIARKVVDLPVPPLHQLAPRIPPVVSGVVGKLLEKDPARRYQSADELHAELLNLQTGQGQGKSTISYPIKALTGVRPRRVWQGAAAAAVVGAILVALAVVWFWPPFVGHQAPPSSAGGVASARRVLRVDQTGNADYRTIKEALAEAGADATIRVLGDGAYDEAVALVGPAHRGLILEAPDHAILEASNKERPAVVRIEGIPDLTLRGFRIKTRTTQFGATVMGQVNGLVLDDVHFMQTPDAQWAALYFLNYATGPAEVRNCTFRCGILGLILAGSANDPAKQVRIENNRFLAANTHLFLSDAVQNVTITGNVFVNGIGVEVNLQEGTDSRTVRVSNNTFLDSTNWIAFKGPLLPPDCVICNNLVIRAQGVNRDNHEIDELRKCWKFRNNWWEPGPATDEETAKRYAEIHQNVDMLSLDADAGEFLRPPLGSPLGSAGAGGEELKYVGAFPPGAPK